MRIAQHSDEALGLAIALIPAVAVYWQWRLGGITGDCHGASIEVTETLLLAACVLG
ncbi:adenosylcobinamide-GDP ribazoletransferase [Bradyrhizobium sp.]|uniref:adenosylcobinamide-GDP ribazoletransferase n=1 Tax=Bradyrhizobium sp. TaxID=376 RepID=UPI00391E036C